MNQGFGTRAAQVSNLGLPNAYQLRADEHPKLRYTLLPDPACLLV